MEQEQTWYRSPLGWMLLEGTDQALSRVEFVDEEPEDSSTTEPDSYVLRAALRQLEDYFDGSLQGFDLPLDPSGTAFQQRVWEALRSIPYGHTQSYLDIARKLQDEKSVRAVGSANGKNPIAVVVPCHRVIGSNGSLVGYAGGIERKRWLLDWEQQRISGQLDLFT